MTSRTWPKRSLQDANFVFFGGSAGIGRAAAVALAADGANIAIVARGKADGEAAAAEMRRAGASSAEFIAADLSTLAGMSAAADAVLAWRPELHGILHTAMAAFNGKQMTPDGLEFAFALQYMARAVLNRRLAPALAASGDGRIVHIAGNVPNMFMPDLDDLQFERRKWSFFKSVLGTHLLGFLHLQQAAALFGPAPVWVGAACVNSTKTKAMADPRMPVIMRLMGKFGARPEVAAANAVRLLAAAVPEAPSGSILRNPAKFAPESIALDPAKAARLWEITTRIAAEHGVELS
ncbi:SDR family NAD(P)-dependent oxidoreductase [Novosphingobium sp. BL-52-GroH]|uniref:SDR family NAD(P)-dependent oxidoreductase n=1 Tax=Novosphingobium sp. BL-52-GroH TaxID=3349877 RepID=UPI00384F5BD3